MPLLCCNYGFLVRREENYKFMGQPERRKLFQMLFTFANSCDINYKTFIFYKKDFKNEFELEGRMAREIMYFVNEKLSYFQDFENIVLYYDNGQHECAWDDAYLIRKNNKINII